MAALAQAAAPSVEVAEARVETSVARTRQTLSRYVPRLGVSGTYRRTNAVSFAFAGEGATVGASAPGPLSARPCPPGTVAASGLCVVDAANAPVQAVQVPPFDIPQNNYAISIDLSIPLSDYVFALRPAIRGADADELAARLQKDAELETVGVNARIAYFDWLRALAQKILADRALTSARARLSDAQVAADAGTLTDTDVLGLKRLVASSLVAVSQAEGFVSLAEQNLEDSHPNQRPFGAWRGCRQRHAFISCGESWRHVGGKGRRDAHCAGAPRAFGSPLDEGRHGRVNLRHTTRTGRFVSKSPSHGEHLPRQPQPKLLSARPCLADQLVRWA